MSDTKRLRMAAKAIYLAVEARVADDVSKLLTDAANEIDTLRTTLSTQEATIQRLEKEVAKLSVEIEERKESTRKQNSHVLKAFLDIKVMLENDELDEALEMLTELTE